MSDNRGQDYVGTPPSGGGGAAATGERRVALVIGNGAYPTAPLKNPRNDADAIARSLVDLHPPFDVTLALDVGRDAMEDALETFEAKLNGCDTALLFFAGHGLQVKGLNYLMPVDADIRQEIHLKRRAIALNEVLDIMGRRTRQSSLVILDACRNNPFARSLQLGLPDDERGRFIARSGLAEVRAAAGAFVAFATAPDNIALDGAGNNSPFTAALLTHIAIAEQSISDLMIAVRQDVLKATEGRQEPWDQSSLRQRFCFHRSLKPTAPVAADATTSTSRISDSDDHLWERIKGSERLADYQFYLEHFPSGRRAPVARFEIRRLEEVEADARQRAEAESRAKAAEEARQREASNWAWAEQANTVDAYERFLAAWTNGRFSDEARKRIAALKTPAPTPKPSVSVTGNFFTSPTATVNQAPLRERSFEVRVGSGADDRIVELAPGQTAPKDAPFAPEMVLVPPGKFWMGSKDGEGDNDERPRHEVTIGYPLLVGKYPVTFEEWDAYVEAGGKTGGLLGIGAKHERHRPNDSGWRRGRRPVINVSWHDTQVYATWLSETTGKTYRLLSEAEWEYACRAGTETAFSFGDESKIDEYAWYGANSGHKTQPVGGKKPNGFGLHDMLGNVYEWCDDAWADGYQGAPVNGAARASADTADTTYVSRVLRGGSWYCDPLLLRSAYRLWDPPGNRSLNLGFRLARTLNPTP